MQAITLGWHELVQYLAETLPPSVQVCVEGVKGVSGKERRRVWGGMRR